MNQTSKNRWTDYSILGLSVFLIFCLLFDPYIELPNLVAWLGRWHPLVLHFPIVLLLVAIFLGLTGRSLPKLLLTVAVISALVTAVLGFFLGKEVPIKGDLLFWHQWLGGAAALTAALWYWLYSVGLNTAMYTKAVQVVLIGLIGFTGHYGGMVTHGEEFLALPTDNPDKKIPDNPLVYQDVVFRILDDKCVACHNPNKQKGELVMTSFDKLLKGGENGRIIEPGNAEESEMIKRAYLPLDDEFHMPPEGKSQLEENQIAILEQWIALGASDTLRLDHLPDSEPLVALIKNLMEPDPSEKWAKLPEVADSTLRNLASDYLSISRIAGNSDALSIVLFPPPDYNPKTVTELQRIAPNVVQLDLSGLPIGSIEIDAISTFIHLERLEIDKTPVGDPEVQKLAPLKNLGLLKIYSTSITDKSISTFKKWPNLNSLYLWDTEVTEGAIASLRKERSDLTINDGIEVETEAFFVSADSIGAGD